MALKSTVIKFKFYCVYGVLLNIFLSYEQSKHKNIAENLGIKFWTTIVVYKGNDEVARIVGQTDKETIYSAIQKGI